MKKEVQQVNTISAYEPLHIAELQFDLQKQYLDNSDLRILPIESISDEVLISSISKNEVMNKVRFFALDKFVYEKDIKISYKLKSVFSALHSVNSSFVLKLVSTGKECKVYVGVKSGDRVNQKADVLKGALVGNFPGTIFQTDNSLKNDEVLDLNAKMFECLKEVTAVVGTPSLKDKEEDQFVQGIENLILGMHGKTFSAMFIADPISNAEVGFTIDAYEQIYSVLSSQKEFVVTDGMNSSESTSFSTSNSLSESFSESNAKSVSFSNTINQTLGKSSTITINKNPWIGKSICSKVFGDKLKGSSEGSNSSESKSRTKGISNSTTNTTSNTKSSTISNTTGSTSGTSTSHQKTFTNKKVSNFLDRLDKQIERLEQGKGIGFWNVGAFFMSDEEQNSVVAANIYNGVVKGAESNFETSIVRTFNSLEKIERERVVKYLSCYEIPRIIDYGYLGQAITTDELTVQINLPHKSVVGLDVTESVAFGNNPPKQVDKGIKIGKLYNYDKCFENDIVLDYNKFTSHIFVTGSTGSGKSNVTYNLIDKLSNKGINFLVIEPAKGEYKDEFGGRKNVSVYGTNPQFTQLLQVNPFEFPSNIHVYEHIDRFVEILNACWPMEAAMPNLLKEAIEDAYLGKGWFLDESRCIHSKKQYPTFKDLLNSLERVIANSSFSAEVKSNYEGALVSRVRSMTNGLNKMIFTEESISDADLFDKNVIIDLSLVASSESKALFMGIIFMKLNEYRIANKTENNSELKHITIIEEAHNLLKRTANNSSSTSGDLAGKSVEMISNAIAEMRTYGEGFIIADQAPGLLDMSVIRNTNTKICMRLPDFEDRKLVGQAMNLTEDQIKELASLETGVASIYQNDWEEAILCKFDKFNSNSREFVHPGITLDRKLNDLFKVIEILEEFDIDVRSITEDKSNFIDEVINLKLVLRLLLSVDNYQLSSNKKRIELKKILMNITGLDKMDIEKIHLYVIKAIGKKGIRI